MIKIKNGVELFYREGDWIPSVCSNCQHLITYYSEGFYDGVECGCCLIKFPYKKGTCKRQKKFQEDKHEV